MTSSAALPLIGAHVSVAGGFSNGIVQAENIGADAIQIFGASPQQWFAKLPPAEGVKEFLEMKKKSRVQSVFLHAAYLVNIASPSEKLRQWSIKNLSQHLKIADMIGAVGLIYHIGAGKELPKEEAMGYVIEGMRTVLENVPGETKLIMENSASSKKLGANAQEIGILLRGASSERIKVCIDTAHAFEAGIIASYTPEEITSFCDELEKQIGLDHVIALHINDSKTVWNSQHDRHENIGEGYIGLEGFKNLAKDRRLHNKVWLLEVPGKEGKGPDKENIDKLRSCFL